MDKTTCTLVALVLCLAITASSYLVPDEVNGGSIVEGEPISVEDVPWQVSITNDDGKHFCGGAIISESFILTSSYCLIFKIAEHIKVRSTSSKRDKGGVLTNVSRIIRHEEFGLRKPHHDIALILLSEPLQFYPAISLFDPVTIPEPSEGELIQFTGWGYTSVVGVVSDVLLEASLPVLKQYKCREIYHDDNVFCAGNREEHMASCNGDSGGPAVWNGTLFGIVSGHQGVACPEPEFAGIISRIADFRSWIYKNAV